MAKWYQPKETVVSTHLSYLVLPSALMEPLSRVTFNLHHPKGVDTETNIVAVLKYVDMLADLTGLCVTLKGD